MLSWMMEVDWRHLCSLFWSLGSRVGGGWVVVHGTGREVKYTLPPHQPLSAFLQCALDGAPASLAFPSPKHHAVTHAACSCCSWNITPLIIMLDLLYWEQHKQLVMLLLTLLILSLRSTFEWSGCWQLHIYSDPCDAIMKHLENMLWFGTRWVLTLLL